MLKSEIFQLNKTLCKTLKSLIRNELENIKRPEKWWGKFEVSLRRVNVKKKIQFREELEKTFSDGDELLTLRVSLWYIANTAKARRTTLVTCFLPIADNYIIYGQTNAVFPNSIIFSDKECVMHSIAEVLQYMRLLKQPT